MPVDDDVKAMGTDQADQAAGKRGSGAAATGAKRRKRGGAGSTAASSAQPPDAGAVSPPSFDGDEVAQVQERLLDWYDRVHRVLPWRRNPHSRREGGAADGAVAAPEGLAPQAFAYRVWVSEVMLQQTQVATVVPYFARWVERWPDVAALAAASQEEVNEVWAGLGYYRRARFLLEGARHVAEKLGGSFPTTAEKLVSIPGIGPYTAAAVASIAFGAPAAAVDGNVVRVLSRLRALQGDPTKQAKLHASLAAQLLHPERPGCHNQAMMELGATVCKPTAPECGECPLAGVCTARAAWEAHLAGGGCPDVEDAPRVTNYPEKVAKAAKREEAVAVTVVRALLPMGTQPPLSAHGAPGGVDAEGSPTVADADGDGGDADGGDGPAADGSGESGGSGAGGQKGRGKAGSGGAAQGAKRKASAARQKKPAAAAPAAPSMRSFLAGAQQLRSAEAAGCVYVLLEQRPPEGLLAGLWQCPLVALPDTSLDSAGCAKRRALADEHLHGVLGLRLPGSAAGVRLLRRHDLGQVVHVFSHIRMTIHAEELTLQADSWEALLGLGWGLASTADGGGASDGANDAHPRAGAGLPAPPPMRWVLEGALPGLGLSTSVRKVLALAEQRR